MRYLVITFVLITGVSFAANPPRVHVSDDDPKCGETITVEYNLPTRCISPGRR